MNRDQIFKETVAKLQYSSQKRYQELKKGLMNLAVSGDLFVFNLMEDRIFWLIVMSGYVF